MSETHPELETLIADVLEGEFDADRQSRLGALLRSDAEATALYTRMMAMHVMLESELNDQLPPLELSDTASVVADESNESERDADRATPLPRRVWCAARDLAYDYLALSLVVSGLFFAILLLSMALIVPQIVNPPSQQTEPPHAQFVARLSATFESQWSVATAEMLEEGDDLFQGSEIELQSGRAEIRFDDGATALLVGPATLRLDSPATATLLRGTMTARVPPLAIGFSVHTKSVDIVDLGTEFGLAVDPLGNTDLHVFEGRVSASMAGNHPTATPAIELATGESMRFHFGSSGEVESLQLAEQTRLNFPRELVTWEPVPLNAAEQVMRGLRPRLYYRFEDGAARVADNAQSDQFDGLYQGAIQRHESRSIPTLGRVARFPGNIQSVIEVADGEREINGREAFAISCWVRADEVGTDHGIFAAHRVAKKDETLTLRYDLRGGSGKGSNVIKIGITRLDPTSGRPRVLQYESASDTQSTEWQHLVVSWASGEPIRLFVDGKLDTPTYAPVGAGQLTGADCFLIGRASMDVMLNDGWRGEVGEFAFFDRPLSTIEVKQLYEAHHPPDDSEIPTEN